MMIQDPDFEDDTLERLQDRNTVGKVAAVGQQDDADTVLDRVRDWLSDEESYDDAESPLTVYARTTVDREDRVVGRRVEYDGETVFESQYVVLDDGSGLLTYEPGEWEDRLDELYEER
ncbi:MAG: hypothetical protein SVU32_09720 [Candidatus Nanohaloarchaea archaeon]|nr:hypothetical protein [Candidatus Nanohaloarchaea archaeon]